MAKALLFLAVTLVAAVFVVWLTLPHPSKPPPDAVSTNAVIPYPGPPPSSASPAETRPPATALPVLATPLDARTAQQKAMDDLEEKRAPFYSTLRQQFGLSLADVRPADSDAQTLDFFATEDDPEFAPRVLADALQPQAARYGFRKARIYLPNPRYMVERYRLDTEASCDAQNHWNAFKK